MSAAKNGFVAGPRRLILIQSGKYDYAELDLTQPFQLVGVNGLGKTALISTLQYLYLDSQRDMRFGQHTTDESRRFYFKGDSSFILYECETSMGTVTVGTRGQGPVAGYELQRFAWTGGYNREDFIAPDGRPRTWEEVSKVLGLKGLNNIDNLELRRLLGAIDENTSASWGLVPLIDARDYPRFRQTFQRLLQLRDLRQDDLKQLLADCAKLSPAEREVDLAKEFEKELGRITRDRAEVDLLRKAVPHVREVRSLHDQEFVARAIAHAVTAELQIRFAGHSARFHAQANELCRVRDEARTTYARLQLEQTSLGIALKEAAAAQGVVDQSLKHLAQAKLNFADFNLDIEEQSRDRLNDEINDLNMRLADVPKEPLEVLARLLADKQNQLKQREAAVKRLGDLFITWLRARLPEENIARLGAMLDRRVLESVMDEQISIHDEAALLLRLKTAADCCDPRGYTDNAIGIEFAPGAITGARQLGKMDHECPVSRLTETQKLFI